MNGKQNIYICKMDTVTKALVSRNIISQPEEPWEIFEIPLINEGPQPIVDPDGQLHIVYSLYGSWTENYSLGDLRLRKDGDPSNIRDWYKSNGDL